jgi:hypothetical protein
MAKGVSEVKSVSAGGKNGYGVTVTDDGGKAVATFAFASKDLAEKGRGRLEKIIEKSAWVSAG